MATVQLEQLFKACDTRGSGYLDRDELRKLCHRFSICSQDADAIFEDLDHDSDGKIDFQDFEKGFKDFLTQLPASPADLTGTSPASTASIMMDAAGHRLSDGSIDTKVENNNSKAEDGGGVKVWSTHQAWQNLTTELVRAGNMINEETLNALYKELQSSEKPQVVERFEDVIADLLDNMKRLQEENNQLENTWLREKKEHEEHLRRMEEEMDSQVKLVEQQAKAKAQEEAEARRKTLHSKMCEEMDELQSHVSLFEKVDQWLRANETHDRKLTSVHSKLDEALQENRQLRLSLMDTQTNVALTRNELAQIRSQYEDKCRQLYDERERIMGVLQEQGFASKQLQHLQEANRKLQDTNDILRTVLEKAEKNKPPEQARRESFLSDYLDSPVFLPTQPCRRLLNDRRPLFDHEEEERASAIWSTRTASAGSQEAVMSESHLRSPTSVATVVEEADSGLSTLRSVAEADTQVDNSFDTTLAFDATLPSLSSDTVSLRPRSLSSVTSPVLDREDSLDSSAAALSASHGNACLGPPVTLRHRKLKSERSVESLPPTLGDIAAKSPAVREERATSVSASSESGIGSRNTWCSMESIDGSPKAPNRGNLSSRRISEIKRQLGVDPVTARYNRNPRSPSGSFRQIEDSPPATAPRSRRQRSLSPTRNSSPPVPLPRSRIPASTEPKPRPRKHLSRQDNAVTSPLDDVDSHFEEPPVFDEDCPRTSTPQAKVAVADASLHSVQRAASFTCCTGPPEHTFKVVFVGDAAVGKSSFIMRLSRGIFMPQLTSTLGVDFQTKNIRIDGVNVSLQLWDTAGQERFRCITQSYFRKADGVMLMYDCTNEQSFLNVRQWMSDLEEAASRGIPIVLVSNKTDLREIARVQGKSIVEKEAGEKISEEMKAIFVETSAKDGSNINEAIASLTRTMMKRAVPDEDDKVTLSEKGGKSFTSKCCNKQ
ncbi:ras and EF-hand domain-containing protein homolog [Ixodes scapularis]|uniref:ras and EF-hand domain-containing protein homolog n=1 Tax=Ixodes scapularis TaxID=6945 RepID=UPI001A9DF437|nr:ras and EF-hand domain-containing protein homolog [Ixodes scapularis]